MKYFSLIFLLLSLLIIGCNAKRRIYLEKYQNSVHPKLSYDLKFQNLSDTQYVRLRYHGDFGRIYAVTYELKEELPDGRYKVYAGGKLQTIGTYKYRKKNGIWKYLYNSGICSSIRYINGAPQGLAFSYYSGKKIRTKAWYTDGDKGLMTSYRTDGSVISHEFSLKGNLIRSELFNYDKMITKITDRYHTKESAVSPMVVLNGERRYAYPEGEYIVHYKDNHITDFKYLAPQNLP
jgi:hypothetical protein